MFFNEDRQLQSRMKSHLRFGVTPALFELDILRYEQLRAKGSSSGAGTTKSRLQDVSGYLFAVVRRFGARSISGFSRALEWSASHKFRMEQGRADLQ